MKKKLNPTITFILLVAIGCAFATVKLIGNNSAVQVESERIEALKKKRADQKRVHREFTGDRYRNQ